MDLKYSACLVVVAHAFSPSTQEAEAGRQADLWGQHGIQSSKFQDWLQSYWETLSWKRKNNNKMEMLCLVLFV